MTRIDVLELSFGGTFADKSLRDMMATELVLLAKKYGVGTLCTDTMQIVPTAEGEARWAKSKIQDEKTARRLRRLGGVK